MSRSLLVTFALTLGLAACSDTVPGYATVEGNASQDGGGPVINTPVQISCDGGALEAQAETDSVGHYFVNLTSRATGRLQCSFGAPSLTAAISGRDTTIGFASANQPHAIQFVDLLPQLVR